MDLRARAASVLWLLTNYWVDVQAGIIVDVEATSAHRIQEVESTRTMLERVEHRFGIRPTQLIGDTAYGTAPMLGWLVNDKQIAPHIPVFDKSGRTDGTFSVSDFTFDAIENRYQCPNGKFLNPPGSGTLLGACRIKTRLCTLRVSATVSTAPLR